MPLEKKKAARNENSAERAYERVREMAISFRLRPGERLNEIDLARELGVSRTPLRVALNRLASEGFLRSVFNRGFYCRALDVKEIADLYEVRCETEVSGIRLACARATDDQIDAFEEFSRRHAKKALGMATTELVQADEQFHEGLAALSGNGEIVRIIQNINARIRFVRCIDIERHVPVVVDEHEEILKALRSRDVERCDAIMRQHVSRRQDQIVDVIKEGVAQIYMRPQPERRPAAPPAPPSAA